MNKIIKMSQIKKLTSIIESILYEQITLKPDGRVIANKERALENTLNKITTDIKKQIEIEQTIYNILSSESKTYKAICDDLKKLGYTIIEEV